MFMSMFSHFEVSQAQKWGFSLGLGPAKAPTPKPNTESPSSTAASQESKTTTTRKSSSAPGGANQNPTRFRPRFAPELDGINCFESIVPC